MHEYGLVNVYIFYLKMSRLYPERVAQYQIAIDQLLGDILAPDVPGRNPGALDALVAARTADQLLGPIRRCRYAFLSHRLVALHAGRACERLARDAAGYEVGA